MKPCVTWPAFIKYHDDNELDYIGDRSELDDPANQPAGGLTDADYLVDSTGRVFHLSHDDTGAIVLDPSDRLLDSAVVAGLVQRHLSVCGACCVAKLNPDSIESSLQLLEQSRET